MITALVIAVLAFLLGHLAGGLTEAKRVLDYLDHHLDRDGDWLRSGIAHDEHHARKDRS